MEEGIGNYDKSERVFHWYRRIKPCALTYLQLLEQGKTIIIKNGGHMLYSIAEKLSTELNNTNNPIRRIRVNPYHYQEVCEVVDRVSPESLIVEDPLVETYRVE